MRTPLAWALILMVSACADRPERADGSGALASIPAGQDPIVLRIPQDGGFVSAVSYPGLDSTVWRSSSRVPPLARALGYDPEDGYLTAVDTAGRPVRVDLRLGAVAIPGSAGSALHATADGATLFAFNRDGAVARYTPVGDRWSLATERTPDAIVPLRDGSLLLVMREPIDVVLRRVRPPDSAVVDSMRLGIGADSGTVHGFAVGDRAILSAGSQVISLRTRDFVRDLDVDVGEPVRDIAISPSGDRVFVITASRSDVRVIDRFTGDIAARVKLPAIPTALRVDPLGRALLVRGPSDSVWVVDVGTASLVGALRSTWRGDLPLVLPDGAVALVHGDTVVLASSLDLGTVRSIPRGARDFWYAMRWNGFRPRAEGLDEPVRFRASDGPARSEGAPTLALTPGDSTRTPDSTRAAEPAPAPGGTQRDSAAGTVSESGRSPGFTVQLAAVLNEGTARDAASGITVDGRSPRITTSVRDGRTLYRVVLGPYPTREEAERVGKATGRSYWVFEGVP